MAAGKSFTMTDKRIEELKYLLGRQYSVRYVANKWNITAEALSVKMSELGLNARELKRDGISTLRADVLNTIDDIEEPEKKAKITLDYLKQFDNETVQNSKEEQESNPSHEIIITLDTNESI